MESDPHSNLFDLHRRQIGVLDVERAGDLRVCVGGASPALPALLYLLAQSGIGSRSGALLLDLPEGTLLEHALDRAWLFTRAGAGPDASLRDAAEALLDDLGPGLRRVRLPPGVGVADLTLSLSAHPGPAHPGHRIGLRIDPAGFRVGPDVLPSPNGDAPRTALTPSLAAAAAAAATHMGLVLTAAMRATPWREAWVTISYTSPAPARRAPTGTGARVGWRPARFVEEDPGTDGGATIRRVSLPATDPRVQDLLARTAVLPLPSAFDRTVPGVLGLGLEGNEPAPVPEFLPAARVLLGGAGGLGSWIGMLLAESLQGGAIDFVDLDPAIEVHNLNRQVLYRATDVGSPKAIAAERALRGFHPEVTVRGHRARVDGSLGVTCPPADEALRGADLVVAAFDSFAARADLAALAAGTGSPLVSGGAEGTVGDAQMVLPGEGCLICRWTERHGPEGARRMATSEEVHACTREIPGELRMDAAPASTVALAGALQALACAFALLPTDPTVPDRRPRTLSFDLALGTLVTDRRGPGAPTADHSEHLMEAATRLASQESVALQLSASAPSPVHRERTPVTAVEEAK